MKIRQSPSRVTNRLKGLIATPYNFTTAPVNLENITDEDWTTVSGTGVRICTGAWEPFELHYDLGTVRSVLLMGKTGAWSNVGQVPGTYIYSTDGILWYGVVGWNNFGGGFASEFVFYYPSSFVRSRYIGIRLANDTAGATIYAKFYEFAALEFGDFIGKN